MHADIAGYSRLIGQDDVGTLERVRTLRRDLIDPAIAEHGGRIVNTAGDALLMVFDSVEGAVRCAVAVQQQVPAHEADQQPDRRISLRIGINVGDVIPDGTDLHGDVVNVAARLQAECPPGNICVSRGVREHLRSRFDLTFEALGPLNLKNITQPVEVFIIRPDAPTIAKSVERTLVHGTAGALPLPEKPSIAVLPFANLSADPEQEFFSDGVADDIITELSRNHSLFVIARNSSFTYRGRAVDIRQVARELGVRYVLEGSVRRSAGRVRVVAQLIDAEAGNHIWADRYDRTLEDVFAVQDEITAAAVAAILPAVADSEQRRALRKAPATLTAWEAYQRGLWHVAKPDAVNNDRAREFFQQAIALDEAFVAAHAALALAYVAAGNMVGAQPTDDATQSALHWARKAVEIDPNDPDAQAVLAGVAGVLGNLDEALERVSLALAIDPNSALAYAVQGNALLFNGSPSEARGALQRALQLNPLGHRRGAILTQIAISYYFERDYDSAISAARNVLALFPDHPFPHRWLAAALGQLGRINEAKEELRKAQEARSFEVYTRRRPSWFRLEDHEHMLDGLRKAGWQG